MEASAEQLVAATLKYSQDANLRRIVACTHVVNDVLSAETRFCATADIQSNVRKALGISGIPRALLNQTLRYLQDEGLVEKESRRGSAYWRLTTKGRSITLSHKDHLRAATLGVIERHFPKSIPIEHISSWIKTILGGMANDLASRNVIHVANWDWGSMFKEEVSKSEPLLTTLQQKELSDCFRFFLKSDHPDDVSYRSAVVQTLISSRLIAAGIGSDSISTYPMRGAVVIFDTNVLLELGLTAHTRDYRSLIQAVQSLQGEPVYLSVTESEHERIIAHYKKEAPKYLVPGNELLLQNVSDDFIRSAVARGCVTEEDFKVFYDQLSILPPTDHDSIKPYRNQTTELAIQEAKKNLKLQGQINQARQNDRKREKRRNTVEHDACLIKAAEALRENGQEAIILTQDASLEKFAVDRCGPHGKPIVISLRNLVDILSIEGSPEISADQFDRLFLGMLAADLITPRATFTTRDMFWMQENLERMSRLSAQERLEIAEEVASARLRGISTSSPTFKLTISRLVTEKYQSRDEQLIEQEKKALEAETKAESALIALANEEESKIRKENLFSFVGRIAVFWLKAVIALTIIAILISTAINEGESIASLCLDLALAYPGLKEFNQINKDSEKRRKSAKDEARRRALGRLK